MSCFTGLVFLDRSTNILTEMLTGQQNIDPSVKRSTTRGPKMLTGQQNVDRLDNRMLTGQKYFDHLHQV